MEVINIMLRGLCLLMTKNKKMMYKTKALECLEVFKELVRNRRHLIKLLISNQ